MEDKQDRTQTAWKENRQEEYSTMEKNLSRLTEPFDRSRIKQREGAGKRMLDYVSYGDVQRTVIEASGNEYDWTVQRMEFVSDGKGAYWLCVGMLTIPGLGSRCGVGTAQSMNEDSPKSCETDAFKRAAVKFGVALDLYFKGGPPQPQQYQARQDRQADREDVIIAAANEQLKRDAEAFKVKATGMGFTGGLTLLCAHILNKSPNDVKRSDYGLCLKEAAGAWNRAMAEIAEMGAGK